MNGKFESRRCGRWPRKPSRGTGEAQGRGQALIGKLTRPLEHRFGQLPGPVGGRTAAAATTDVDASFTAALDTASLSEVFPYLELDSATGLLGCSQVSVRKYASELSHSDGQPPQFAQAWRDWATTYWRGGAAKRTRSTGMRLQGNSASMPLAEGELPTRLADAPFVRPQNKCPADAP